MQQLDRVLDRVFSAGQRTADSTDTLLWSVFRWLSARTSGADQGYSESPHIMWKQHVDQRNAVPLDYAGTMGGKLACRFMDPKSGEIIRLTLEREVRT